MAGPFVEVPYFKRICREVLDGFLQQRGFVIEEMGKDCVAIIYRKDPVFFEIGYWPEDFPEYSLIFCIGLVERDRRRPSVRRHAGVVPEPPDLESVRIIRGRRFTNEDELRMSLVRLRDEVVAVYAPLF